MPRLRMAFIGAVLFLVATVLVRARVADGQAPEPKADPNAPSLMNQTEAEAFAKSKGCLECHQGIESMHESKIVRLGCVDCHGGDPCATTKEQAHVRPRYPAKWPTSGNPERTFALLNQESPEFIQFVNPGDWRVTAKTCGTAGCHEREHFVNRKSIMGHSVMVPGSAFYNNGAIPSRYYPFGEVYGPDGKAQRMWSNPRPTPDEVKLKGIMPYIDPVPRYEIIQPGNIFRILEINNNATSQRGPGTGFRVDAGGFNVHKTKLNDPTMVFLGTNDHPGDYRSSGCTSCHVLYANDREPLHSAHAAKYGNRGFYAGNDPTIPKDEPGHPIFHKLTKAIPSSQCNTCHFHQGSGALANYYGYIWWDYDSEAAELVAKYGKPGLSGSMGYVSYLGGAQGGPKVDTHDLAEYINPKIYGNKFADFHNAGWLMQAVYKRDKKGQLVDKDNKPIPPGSADWHKRAVHLADIHLQKGMHCVDCHFEQDNHGNGKIYMAMIDEIEINCKDCHGTVSERSNFRTSNPAAPEGGNNLMEGRTPFGERRFVKKGDKVFQRSSVTPGLEWEVVQVVDVVTPGNPRYSEKARYAKTMQKDGKTWGHVPKDDTKLAHHYNGMTCYACHSSWNTQCSGCHLDARTNLKSEDLHYEGDVGKVYSSYSPDVIRSEGYMLARNGTVQGKKVSPVRSASAVIASASDANRAQVVHQQPTIAAEGNSGHAYTTNPPHTVRGKETKSCSDCHVSAANDNNATVARAFGLGARSADMVGRYAWVAERGKGFEAIRVTAGDDFPQPVIGSDLFHVIMPENDKPALRKVAKLEEAWGHRSWDARGLQRYGEWMLVADGSAGLRVFDIANVANKDKAQRIVESPLSPLGQGLRVKSHNATSVALASVLPVDTKRSHRPENEEPPLHPIYRYAYVTDFEEGLIVIDIHTLVDSNPSNNFLKRTTTFNPDGILNGAVAMRVAGTYAYVLCKAGLVVLDISDPCRPQAIAVLDALQDPRAIEIQFRYAFITDSQGFNVVDITHPEKATLVSQIPMRDARGLTVMRTYAYVAGGADGLAVIDVETPTKPNMIELFSGEGGCINDATAVVPGATYASLFLFLADGKNGLRVISVAQPSDGDDIRGVSPVPRPRLIASYKTRGPAVALSEGMPRDRYVDETGNQFCVLGRRGSRAFTQEELHRMYLRNGELYTVTDDPPGPPVQP